MTTTATSLDQNHNDQYNPMLNDAKIYVLSCVIMCTQEFPL